MAESKEKPFDMQFQEQMPVQMNISMAARQALEQIVVDGVEMRATASVLFEWLKKHGYIVIFRLEVGGYHYRAMRSDGRHLDGKEEWLTYHEMIADLLARIDVEGGA